MFGRKRKYDVNVICDNCDQRSVILIPKGITISDHLKDNKGLCPNCGVPIKLEFQQKMEGDGMLNA